MLPQSAIEVRAEKYLWDGWPASLDRYELFPTSRAPAYANLNQTWWFTITPPAGAKPGIYSGTVRLLAQSGAVSIPLSVEVLPFQLASADQHGAAYSLWRNSDYNMSYALRYFMPAKMDYFRRLLRAEAADMKAHGMTMFHFTRAGDHRRGGRSRQTRLHPGKRGMPCGEGIRACRSVASGAGFSDH